MNKRNLAIGAALAILVGIWLFRDGKESPSIRESAPRPDIPSAQAPQPPRWTAPPPTRQTPSWGYEAGYPGATESLNRSPMQAYPSEEPYRFRPLRERERRRIEEQARAPYGPSYPYPSAGDSYPTQRQPGISPSLPAPSYGVDPAVGDPWGPDWGSRSWGTEGYSFRQPDAARPNIDRAQGPYWAPVRPGDRPPTDPGVFQEPNQWGAVPPQRTPPSLRMYPSLDAHRDRRLAVRQ